MYDNDIVFGIKLIDITSEIYRDLIWEIVVNLRSRSNIYL
jgi:hypothetical protein